MNASNRFEQATAPTAGWQVLHASFGRLRVHLAPWPPARDCTLADQLKTLPGVKRAEANILTQNVLLVYDPGRTTAQALLRALPAAVAAARTAPRPAPEPAADEPEATTVHEECVPVHGLDRDPHLGARVVEHLQKALGVRAWINVLTSQVHVAYDRTRVRLEDIHGAVNSLQQHHVPGEDRPRHPLDPDPLRDGINRVVGAVSFMGLLTFQRMIIPQLVPAPLIGAAAAVAGLLNLVQGFPAVRDGIRGVLGRRRADLLMVGTNLTALSTANMPLGLVVAGLEGFFLAEEVAARQAAYRRYEDSIDTGVSALPGATIRLEAGTRVPRDARVLEGFGTALGSGGQQHTVAPGGKLEGGSLLLGGPFVLELEGATVAPAQPRPAPLPRTRFESYQRIAAPVALGVGILQALRTGSLTRALEAMLLLNPRPAVQGTEMSHIMGGARALRGGMTIVGTRPERRLRRPDAVLLDGARLLTDAVEVSEVLPLQPGLDQKPLLQLTAAISEAAGDPWGAVFAAGDPGAATDGTFHGRTATARLGGTTYYLRQLYHALELHPSLDVSWLNRRELLLELRADGVEGPLGLITLRPRIAAGVAVLVEACQTHGVELAVLPGGDPAVARVLCQRAGVPLLDTEVVEAIQARQLDGKSVAVVSDGAEPEPAFAACDLAIGISRGHSGLFPARADLLAADLRAVADLLDAGARQAVAMRDSVTISIVANAVGLALALRGPLTLRHAPAVAHLGELATFVATILRLRGGERPESALAYLTDPRPERWGRRNIADALRAFGTTEDGLTSTDALARKLPDPTPTGREELLMALRNQVRAPITALLTGGACMTMILGQPLNTALLGFTIGLNVVAGVWQERQVGKAAEALRKMSAASARVLRDGQVVTIAASDVVLGDVLVLGPGARVPADARMLSASALEVAEAALTGESIPVTKGPEEGAPARRIVLDGSDVVSGTGRAVVIAVGRHSRLGATAAALNFRRTEDSPLGARLGRVLRVGLPVSMAGGTLVTLAGLAYATGPIPQLLTLGLTTALSAIPEGLPLLAGVGQAAVARRLAEQNVVVRRLAGIEALGRVDVTCSDKTGTLTEGRLSLAVLADRESEAVFPGNLEPGQHEILAAAGLACPNPDGALSGSHPTDAAVLRAAEEIGLGSHIRQTRQAEVPFDSSRAYHVSLIDDHFWVKGAPERVLARCASAREQGRTVALDEERRRAWLDRAASLAKRGLRVLAVAEGPADTPVEDPMGLTVLGFLGIRDPLRPGVPEAVQRCQRAGVRIIMLTGDHPATAGTIGQEAGLLVNGGEVVTAAELTRLSDEELDRRMEKVAVIARAAPLDKLRFVESLRRCGHSVAMTGDGVNDAPSLRLADVGVAMGRGGTEVARQAADVVLADDNFASLVQALVEGRGFWRNMRTGLGLLVGGNAGELGMIVGASLLGLGSPLSAPQILMVNLITDTLPSLAILLQKPQHRDLAALAREGLSALDVGLRRDALHRGLATGVPSLAAFLLARAAGGPEQGRAVGFASVILTQLAQTLDAGRVQGFLSRSVVGAVGGSMGLLAITYAIPPLRTMFNLVLPTPLGWGYVGAASAGAVVLSRAIAGGLPHAESALGALRRSLAPPVQPPEPSAP